MTFLTPQFHLFLERGKTPGKILKGRGSVLFTASADKLNTSYVRRTLSGKSGGFEFSDGRAKRALVDPIKEGPLKEDGVLKIWRGNRIHIGFDSATDDGL